MDPAAPIIEPPIDAARAVLPIERVAAGLEVILCSGFPTQIIVFTLLHALGMPMRLADGQISPPFVFALTLLDTLLVVGLILFFMRAHRESVREQLFGSRPIGLEMVLGLFLIPASFVVILSVLKAIEIWAPSLHNVPHNPMQDLIGHGRQAAIFAFVAMVGGGVREEIQRGFALRRFEQYLGGGAVGLVVFNALFGLGHLEQGQNVALATATLGAFWGLIYLRRRSIAGPIVGHAGFNLAQVLIFLGQRRLQ